jgi:glycosyltransferase involved in cell wall biosynthesis
MKIAFAYDSAYPWFNGGIERRRFIIAREFVKNHDELHFFTMYREGMPSMNFIDNGIHYHCVCKALPSNKMYINGKRNIWWSIKYGCTLFFHMLPYKFDFVDSDSFPFFHTFSIWAYCNIRSSTFIMTWHEVWTKNYWKEYLGGIQGSIGYFIERLSVYTSDHFIAVSTATEKDLIREFRIKKDRIRVLHAAISEDEIRITKKAPDLHIEKKFLIVGRLIPEKNTDAAIKAMKNVNAKLIVVGEGPEEHKLKSIANGLGIKDRIVFKSRITRKELIRQFKSAEALILTSEREGLSMITVEALTLGTPVIITNKTMLPEEVRSMCIGSKSGNLEETMKYVILNQKSIRLKTSKEAARVIREFSAKGAVKVYLSLLK